MDKQNDRHLETPGEANRDKHINFLAEESGDIDPADENINTDKETSGEDNGFFTDDDNKLQTKEENEEDKSNQGTKTAKVIPLDPDITTPTLGDKITVNSNNEDIVTLVTDDDNDSYEK